MAYPNRPAFDAVAGALIGGAICAGLAVWLHSPVFAAAGAGAATLVGGVAALAGVASIGAMPAFAPLPLDFQPQRGADASGELREAIARLRGAVR